MTASTGRRQARLLHRQRRAYRVRTAALLVLCMLPVAATFAAPSVFPTGVTRYDPDKAWNGYVLFSGQDKKTHLIDMNGNEVHQWAQEGFPPVLLAPDQTGGARGHVLLQLGQLPGARAAGNGLGNAPIGELDWDGKVVWRWGAAAQLAYGGADTSTSAAPGGSAKQHHDWERAPPAEREYPDRRRHERPRVPSDTQRRHRLGIRQPVLRRFRGGRQRTHGPHELGLSRPARPVRLGARRHAAQRTPPRCRTRRRQHALTLPHPLWYNAARLPACRDGLAHPDSPHKENPVFHASAARSLSKEPA
jgi:hypothetical protein